MKQIDKSRIPRHVAIIMDGNGRWSVSQNKERFYGHQKGVEAAKAVSEVAVELGIEYLTLYAFSKENWKRPKAEIDGLMNLLIIGVTDNLPEFQRLNIKLNVIGDLINLPKDVSASVVHAIDATRNNTGLQLVIALNYGGRWEILEAVKEIASNYKDGKIQLADIEDQFFSDKLTTVSIPDPDLLIRTSGEYRISNFLLWQISYSELYFTDLCWPDFKEEQFMQAIIDYQSRERRFGKTSKQIVFDTE